MRFARTLGPVARALSARSLRTSSVLRPLPYKGAASPLNVRRADARNFERAGCAIGTRAYATEASETKREGGEKSEERSSFFK